MVTLLNPKIICNLRELLLSGAPLSDELIKLLKRQNAENERALAEETMGEQAPPITALQKDKE